MQEASFASVYPFVNPAPAPAPNLRPVPQAAPDDSLVGVSSPASSRTISLGGLPAPRLSAFSLSGRLRGRDVLSDTDLTPDEIAELLDTALRLKRLHRAGEPHAYLPGKTLALIFQHPSTRTRVSFEAGMAQLGGQAIFLGVNDLQLKRGETIGDTGRIVGGYVDAIVARVADHADLVALADSSPAPVFNGLSDRSHPLQALSDLMTIQEQFGALAGLKLAYLGDGGNNMAASLLLAGAATGMHVTVAAPAAYQPAPEVVTHAAWLAGAGSGSGARISVTTDPWTAVRDADVVYTDVHVSLGQADGAARAVALVPYKVTEETMAAAKPGAVFMHCLPMHRDEEVDAAVADGPQSIVFAQAENRLHLQKALLLHALC